MKQLLFLVFISFMLIGCASKIYTIRDDFYNTESYRTSEIEVYVSLSKGIMTMQFRTYKDKIYLRSSYRYSSLFTTSKDDYIILKFDNDETLNLKYTSYVPSYSSQMFWIDALSTNPLDNFETLKIVRLETDEGYRNFEISKKTALRLQNDFNMIKAEVTAKYGN